MDVKVCCRCKEEKNVKEFYSRKKSKDGLRGECKDCNKIEKANYLKDPQNRAKSLENRRKWIKNNKDRLNATRSQYREENRERINYLSNKWYHDNKKEEALRRSERYKKEVLAKYGKTELDIPELCDLCGLIFDNEEKKPRLDHNHNLEGPESFRGFVCNSCNVGLGMFGDNLQGLQKAIDYLMRYENGI